MTANMQDTPFRETAWDQRLDKMLDDLKTTVTPEPSRRDQSLTSSFRSSSRSDSRTSNRSAVEDGGLMKHQHKEYTSPDKTTRVITDEFEYDAGDPNQYRKKVMKSTYSKYNVTGDITRDLDSLRQGPENSVMAAARATADTEVVSASQKVANKLVDALSTIGPTQGYSTSSYSSTKTSKHGLPNGKPSYDDDDMEIINEPSGGEVRRIVWRNRFEKTHEANDGTPSITIEEEAKRQRRKQFEQLTSANLTSFQQPQPPQSSPGGQSWADPIPMATPPNISPKGEPGVAYVYTYGQSGSSQVQHLPPLNYVAPGPSDGAPPSPTPSGSQPIIYHYSYHYNMQPGQPIPDGVPQPPKGSLISQPALQVAPAPTTGSAHKVSSYEYKKSTTSHNVDRSDLTNIHHHDRSDLINKHHHDRSDLTNIHHHDRSDLTNIHHHDRTDLTNIHHHHHHPPGGFPRSPYDDPVDSRHLPRGSEPEPGSKNISIHINKTTKNVTQTKEYPPVGPCTSTPFPTPGRRSRSSSPDRYPRGGTTSHITTHIHRTTNHTDSLDRVRKHPNEGLPFPDTSPIKPREGANIPKRVDDLMTSFPDSEDGLNRRNVDVRGMNGPKSPSPEREPLISTKVSVNNANLSVSEKNAELKKEESKNVAGTPVYYPPGHHQLFDESMHTMTLKESKRRGMAKWRMEKASGQKESASSSNSKGGMAMVPVCLPLCCGAACAIM